MLTAQKTEWELAGKNFAGLDNAQVRAFDFDGFVIKVQFNPARIISSAARVDNKSIEARPCFLCQANRPKEQRGVSFGDYSVLINPFPIFPEHFTIPAGAHIPQRIMGNFAGMLNLAKAMEGYTLFYNGPKCGASAPDHFHFQAGNSGFMPIDNEIEVLKEKYGHTFQKNEVAVWAVKDGLRNFVLMKSANNEKLSATFDKVFEIMAKLCLAEEEPMVNMLTSFINGAWRVLIFPRALHRPWQYGAEGDDNILLSPASVDMGGVLITPLEKDFKKITKADIKDIFGQVLLSVEKFDELISLLKL